MRIRLMADLHYMLNKENEIGDTFFRDYLRHFFQDEPAADWYVSLGDITQNGEEAEYRSVFSIIDSLGKRASFVHIPGNHDLYTADASQAEQWGSTPPIADGHGAMLKELGLFVFLDSCQVKSKMDWGGRLEDRKLDWFAEQLARSDGKPVFVFAHHPLPGTTALTEQEMMRIEQANALGRILESVQAPCIWFNGHNHIQSIIRRGNWTFVQTASAVCLPCWRDVEIADDAVRITTRRLTEPAIVEAAERTLGCYPSFHRVDADTAAGGDEDQEVEVVFSAG